MKINWKVRFKNKLFLTSLASQTILLVQGILTGLVGLGVMHINLNNVSEDAKIIMGMVDVVLGYLSFLGIIVDPTTDGIKDSEQAMTYEEPKK